MDFRGEGLIFTCYTHPHTYAEITLCGNRRRCRWQKCAEDIRWEDSVQPVISQPTEFAHVRAEQPPSTRRETRETAEMDGLVAKSAI